MRRGRLRPLLLTFVIIVLCIILDKALACLSHFHNGIIVGIFQTVLLQLEQLTCHLKDVQVREGQAVAHGKLPRSATVELYQLGQVNKLLGLSQNVKFLKCMAL